MKNLKKVITPNEINKYIYCPYQWYYERKYGRKEINELYKERNKKLNLENKTYSNFKKGTQYHDNYYVKYTATKIIKKIAVILIIVVIMFYFLRHKGV